MDSKEKILELFKGCRALLEGHFILTSGKHSPGYLQCALVLQHPRHCEDLALQLAGEFSHQRVDAVASPAVGAIVLGQEVARAMGARAVFAERVEGTMTFRRGFKIEKGEKVLVVEDVVTTGGSVAEIVSAVKEAGGEPVGVGALVDRSGGAVSGEDRFGIPFKSLLTMQIETYPPENCPLCRQGSRAVKPGSRGL
jgi:orotate phosphoribosyltransferase